VGKGGEDDRAGGGGRDGEPVEVPLRHCGRGGGALDAGANGKGPEVDEDEEQSEEPGADVDDEEIASIGQVPAKEDAREHGHP